MNAALPGAGLVLRGDLLLGFAFALAAVVCLAIAGLAALIGAPLLAAHTGMVALIAYLALALAAAFTLRLRWPTPRFDAAAVRARFDVVAHAYLNGRAAEALAEARVLARQAPQEAGAWRLVALTAEAAGDARSTAMARARADALERA